ncbi:MAG: hypothetical protein ABWX67_04540 [Allosphingosinicella sp.]
MSDHRKGIVGQACIFVSATHVLVEISESLLPVSHRLEAIHRFEPGLLGTATAALLLHLLLERAFFDRIIAAAHAGNLIIGWLGASAEWLSVLRVVRELSWFRTLAALALLLAATATVVEILGLRHQRRRASLIATALVLALCLQPRDDRDSPSMPPHSRFERREFVIGPA